MGEFFAAPRRALPELCDGIKRYLHPRCTCIRKDEDHRIDGDFSADLKSPVLLLIKDTDYFAPEIRQKHTESLIKTRKEEIGILWMDSSQEECRQPGCKFQKLTPGPKKYPRSCGLKLLSSSYRCRAKKIKNIIVTFALKIANLQHKVNPN